MKITEIFSVDEDLKADPANCKIIATLSNGTIKTLCDVKEAAPSNPDLSSAAWCGGEPDQAGPCRVYQQARQPAFYLNEISSGGFFALCSYNIYGSNKAGIKKDTAHS